MSPIKNAALILIDVQEGFNESRWGIRNNPHFEKNTSRLLRFWREIEWPVIHVQHLSTDADSSLRPDQPGVRFMEFAQPEEHEKVFTKAVNSAFIGTSLEAYLRENELTALLLAGLTTDHCVSTSARMAKNLGFDVAVAEDATATFNRSLPNGTQFEAELVHRIALASLNEEFAAIRSVDQLIHTYGRSIL